MEPCGLCGRTEPHVHGTGLYPVIPGHNNPPDMSITAGEISNDLSGWMAEHPVIQTEEDAREAKLQIDRGSLCVKDLEDERKGKVNPLNEQVKVINDHYRSPRELLETMVDELKRRVTGYLRKEEETKFAVAEAARLQAQDAERVAREAEERERSAYGEASEGILGVDLGNITAEADEKFRNFEKASRAAALAERETRVKIGGGFTRALGLRNRETLYVYNAEAAVATLGPTDDIVEAILKSARAYRKLHNKLPNGVSSDTERKT